MEHLILLGTIFLLLTLKLSQWGTRRVPYVVFGNLRIFPQSKLFRKGFILLFSVYGVYIWIYESSKNVNKYVENGKYYTEEKYVPPEPIDIVYTWDNGTDDRWWQEMSHFTNATKMNERSYADNNKLLYSLRSIGKYAPWIRHIYIVTNGQIPSWLNLNNPRVTVVPHSDIVPPELAQGASSTFSSMAIEMWLHRIPNLSLRFLYLNDDIFLGRPMFLDDLRSERDGIYVVPGWEFEFCATTCRWRSVGNEVCDDGCNVAACDFDGGDCIGNKSGDEKQPAENLLGKNLYIEHYIKSLIHTHEVLTARYGYKKRQMIAHVGFLIDRKIMYDIEQIFPEEMKAPKYRAQYALLYHEVLMNEMRGISDEEMFDSFDPNHDGKWTTMEIKKYLAAYHRKKARLYSKHFDDLCKTMENCSASEEDDIIASSTGSHKSRCVFWASNDLIIFTREQVFACPQFMSKFRDRFGKVRKYKGTIRPDLKEHSYFYSPPNSSIDVLNTLNHLRESEKLFICINNGLSSNGSEDFVEIVRLLGEFYESRFPVQSKFELPHGTHNDFQYIGELRSRRMFRYALQCASMTIGLVLCCLAIAFVRSRIKTRRLMCETRDLCL